MTFIFDNIGNLMIAFASVAAIIYGYDRWRQYRHKEEFLWCVLGIFGLLILSWDYATRHVLLSMIDTRTLSWSRQLLDLTGVLACIALWLRAYVFRKY
jgi:hypothetical protein